MKKTLFMLFCLLCSIGAMAQKKTITGVVTDATGEAVIGASIVETGTTNGTVTDLDGNFTLSVANDGSIRVSFVGYQTQTLSVKGKSTFKIALKEDSEMLQEVVVTGYGGKQLRTKVTNSISKVKEETLKQGLYSNPAQAYLFLSRFVGNHCPWIHFRSGSGGGRDGDNGKCFGNRASFTTTP